jgi:hypothetical protein
VKRWKGNPRLGIVLDKRSPMHQLNPLCLRIGYKETVYSLYNSTIPSFNCIWSFVIDRILSYRLKKVIKSLASLACGCELFHKTNEIEMFYIFHFPLKSSLSTPCMQMMLCQNFLHRLMTICVNNHASVRSLF